jgi:segregation and condensation protein B
MDEVSENKMEPELNENNWTPPANEDQAEPASDTPALAETDTPVNADPGGDQDNTAEPVDNLQADDATAVAEGADGNDSTASVAEEESTAPAVEDEPAAASEEDDGEEAEAADKTAESDEAGTDESATSDGPTPEVTTEQVVEAVLFGADTPLTAAKIVSIIGTGSARDVRKHIETLNKRYAETGASFRIEKIAGGYQMLTLPAFNPWLKRLKQTRQESKLSQAALETLAVVAYKQPVVRAEIEAIRGVSAGEMLNRLRELGLIKIVGRAEDVGRPLLYGTTKRFLDVFGLGSLDDLPTVEELKAPE